MSYALIILFCSAGACEWAELPVPGCGWTVQMGTLQRWRAEHPGAALQRWSCVEGRAA